MKWECVWKNKVWKSDKGMIITKNYSDTLGGTLPAGVEFWVFRCNKDRENGINMEGGSFFTEYKKVGDMYERKKNPTIREVKKWVDENA